MPHLYKDIPGWFTYSSLYDQIVDRFPNGTFAEVGCWFGKSSVYLLEKIKEKKYNITVNFIDTWIGGDFEPERELVKEKGFSYVFEKFLDNLYKFDPDVNLFTIYREFSDLTANKFADLSLDFVFIDAGHRGLQPYNDVRAWYPKVKDGGVIAGHDIDFKDVREGIDRFCNEEKLSYEIRRAPEHCWVINK